MPEIFYQTPGKYFAAHHLQVPVEWEHIEGQGYRCKGDWPEANGVQPDAATVDAWDPQPEPPEPSPVTDVEMRVGEMQANRATASLKTDAIKARILQALVDGGMDESQGKGLGIAIIKDHFQALVTFEIGGGGATASQVLYADLAADHRLAPFLSIISDVLGVSGRIK